MTPLAYRQRCTRLDETRDDGRHARAWVWAARFGTPVWRRIPLGARDVLLAAGDEVRLAEPVDVSVEYVDRSRFHPLSVPFAQAWEFLASVDEPSVIFVDANGLVLALITEEHAFLLLRGHISDWPTDA